VSRFNQSVTPELASMQTSASPSKGAAMTFPPARIGWPGAQRGSFGFERTLDG
jgi:hypothetical protein